MKIFFITAFCSLVIGFQLNHFVYPIEEVRLIREVVKQCKINKEMVDTLRTVTQNRCRGKCFPSIEYHERCVLLWPHIYDKKESNE